MPLPDVTPDVLPLAASLDTPTAAPLRDALLALIEQRAPLLLDGAAVTRAGLACLQVLASARATAIGEGQAFSIAQPSEALSQMAALAGFTTALGLAAAEEAR